MRILIVCTGNICRSPMGEGLLRKMLRDRGKQGEVVVESAGTFPVEGAPASSEAVATAAEHGVDIRGHVGRALTDRLVQRADLILTMAPDHRDRLVAAYPEAEEKTELITLYGDPEGDPRGVPDPIGQGKEIYERTFLQIQRGLDAAFPKILEGIPDERESRR
ncbi:MAG: hypothetical protein GF346_07065 [Candidatus Eisenbacteria bacterium]|nr:hypothetical protein [Candidatus Latescibacterota bacterium]MBD3302190.1 hypothetical protein [Candidatus Eisenbacteria bacterium]